MTEATTVAPDSAPSAAAPADNSPLTLSEARDLWRSRASEPTSDDEKPVDRDEKSLDPAPRNSVAETDASPRESEPTGENEAADPVEKPSIEPPRSWTKEEKEAFKALPPEHQQRIADRERAREVEIRRVQNEAAEQRKAAQAEIDRTAQERQRYEAQLPVALAAIQQQVAEKFPDIRTMDDVQRMAIEDPLRFNEWQAVRMKYDATVNELTAAQERSQREQAESFARFASEQDRAFQERYPELKNPETLAKTTAAAVEYLTETGFSQEELNDLWTGRAALPLRDARLQSLIMDGVKYRTAKANLAAAPKSQPTQPVQKPGVASNRADASDDRIRTLSNRLDQTGSLKDGLALFRALKR